jgi:hypothetical protein
MGAALCAIRNAVATKALDSGLAKECSDKLTKVVILSACDVDEVYGDDKGGNNEDGNTVIDVEPGHDDSEEADLMMTITVADMDDRDDGDG